MLNVFEILIALLSRYVIWNFMWPESAGKFVCNVY